MNHTIYLNAANNRLEPDGLLKKIVEMRDDRTISDDEFNYLVRLILAGTVEKRVTERFDDVFQNKIAHLLDCSYA